MAIILGLVTVNEKDILEVDAIPSAGGGTAAPVGSLAMYNQFVRESSRFTFSQAGSFYDVSGAAKAVQVYSFPSSGRYFWFFVSDGANVQTDPALVGTGHMVSILSADTSAQVATKLFTAVALLSTLFSTVNGTPSVVDITNVAGGDVADSSVSGSAAALSVLAQGSEIGRQYIKIGSSDTAWDAVSTVTTSGVKQGTFLRLPIYDTSPDGYSIDDIVQQNSQNIDVAIQAQPSRSTAIEYRIPNPGDAISTADFILSEGAQTKNGNMTFTNNVIVGGDLTVNGSLTYLNSTQTQITDKLITLNKGGAAASAGGAGFEFEENSLITGYLKVAADRNGFEMLAPNSAFKNDLDLSSLTADRVQRFADTGGTFAMRPTATPFVANQIAYGQDANNLVSEAGFEYNPTSNVLSVPSITISGLGLGVVHSSASGVLSSSPVVLTSEVSGVLPIANGGTNSSTALVNDRLMYSSAGAVVEYPALVAAQVYFGAPTTGLPAQDVQLYWDNTNKRLGIGGSGSPARKLDVVGSSLFQGALKIADSAFPKANWEAAQSQVSTTNATITAAATVAVPADSIMLIEARITGRRTSGAGSAGDAASYVRTARFKNVAGTVTMLNLQTDYTSEDVAQWDGTMVASGVNAVVNVKGLASTNVDWTVTYFTQVLS